MRDQIPCTVQCCSCMGTFLWVTFNFVVHRAASLACSWKKKCSQGPLKFWEFSALTALVLSIFLNVTSVGEEWHRRAATALQPRGFQWFRRSPLTPSTKGSEGVSWQFVFHAFCLWNSHRKGVLKIYEGSTRYQRRQGNSSGKCSGRLDSSKCLKPRISSTQRPHLLKKLEKGMSNDANRSMFSSSRFVSSCLPK